MNILKVYDKLKVITKVKKRERYLKHAKPCKPWHSIYIYIYISTILQNKEEVNLINKTRVGGNSTLKVLYKRKA